MNKLYRCSIPVLAALMFLIVGMMFLASNRRVVAADEPAQPEENLSTLLVTTLADEVVEDGACSLREALAAVNTNSNMPDCGTGQVVTDTINFALTGTILVDSQLTVAANGPVVVDGAVITVSGGSSTRVWWVESGSDLTLQNLAVTDGHTVGEDGAGVYNLGSLTLIHTTFSNNHAGEESGCGGGAIHNQGGQLAVTDSLITNNTALCASAWGGGIVNQAGTAIISDSTIFSNTSLLGGGILNFGNMTVTNSTLYDNHGSHEGGGIHNYFGNLTLVNTTLTENTGEYSGALHNFLGSVTVLSSTLDHNDAFWGGAVMNQGLLTVTNSTVSGNTADTIGGGIYNTYSGTLTITHATLADNDAQHGSAVYNENDAITVLVINSILASLPSSEVCWGSLTDGGHNISSDNTCNLEAANGSMPDTDPEIKPLQDNGGPTWTHALRPNSPAIDAADDAFCPPSDQRGVPRPLDGDDDGQAACDIGAFETYPRDFSLDSVSIQGPAQGVIEQTYAFTAVVEPTTATLPITYTWLVDGQSPLTHTSGVTDTASFQWPSPGVYQLLVSATNAWNTVTGTHAITITDLPITGLSADNDSPTSLGQPTTLSATITGGTGVTFTWDFGDGQTASGQVVNHIYPAPGVYTATVTASNSANTLTATTQVTILEAGYVQYLPFIVKNDPMEP